MGYFVEGIFCLSEMCFGNKLYQVVGNTHTWIISDMHMNNYITIYEVVYWIYYEILEGILGSVNYFHELKLNFPIQ